MLIVALPLFVIMETGKWFVARRQRIHNVAQVKGSRI